MESKAVQKLISLLKANPSAYIIDWCEGESERDLILSDEPEENISVSQSSFYYLKEKELIEWQTDTDQWGDRYRLTK